MKLNLYMRVSNYLCVILLIVTFSSCLSKKDLAVGNSVLKNDLSILNGTYKNIAANSLINQDDSSLYLLLFKNYHWQNPHYNKAEDYDGSIRLTVLSDKKIKLEHFVNGNIVKSKTLKGKMYNNYFITNRKWRIIGIPIILGGYNESIVAIGLAANGYLNIKKKIENTGGLMPIGASSYTHFENVYFAKTTSNGQEIYNETVALLTSLSKENSDKRIFYKTELHSIDSYVWYEKEDSLISYRIMPDGIKQKTIAAPYYRTLFDPKKSFVPLIINPPSRTSFIGYFECINDKTMRYGISVRVRYLGLYDTTSEQEFIDNDFIRKINEDMAVIKREYRINYYREFY